MLNKDIKTNINNARNILVGKIPNPQMQAEHITIAMIYKFMNDMDNEAISYGGKKSFFVKELEKYSWSNLLSTSLSNQERIDLYTQALDKIQLSQQVPELFRNIFKNAYLPFKDGRILTMFLQEINNISYEDSERTGDAFEYLLSILDSQGDLGSFRTPRNIINFIVDVVAPTKTDTILDPACGTAGFLISAYKYILSQNQNKKPGDKLTPKEKNNLTTNINGYDIAPEMVKLGLANLYLHGFKNPKIQEYDTLTYDTKWNETFDVILANPPFMTPKGGIKPHSLFSIQCNRSEVLFVDYVMEHINLNGRVGIIVPEGIIFQSANAYKSLRKKLIEENFLYAVVSLPSGVFNPYSGVKTSILFMDKQLAKQQKEILFVTVENDGFDLGANRNPIDKNDLPQALQIIKSWQQNKKIESKLALFIDKKEIANNEYNLTASRYIKTDTFENCKYEMVLLGELEKQNKIEFLRGQSLSKKDLDCDGKYKCILYGELYTKYENPIIKDIFSKTNIKTKIISIEGDVLIPGTTTADAMGIAIARALNFNGIQLGGDINIIRTKNKYINSCYLAYLCCTELKKELAKYAKGANILHLSNDDIRKIQIPLPPIEIQNKIVEELESYQAIIDNAKKIVDNWKPTFNIDSKWQKVKLGDVCEIVRGGSPRPIDKYITNDKNGLNWLKIGDIEEGAKYIYKTSSKIKKEGLCKTRLLKKGDFILSNSMSFGRPYIMQVEACIHDGWVALQNISKSVNKEYLYFVLSSNLIKNQFLKFATGSTVKNLKVDTIKLVEISLPSLKEQEQIVSQIQEEEQTIQSCKKLIEIYKQKISDKIKSVWEN